MEGSNAPPKPSLYGKQLKAGPGENLPSNFLFKSNERKSWFGRRGCHFLKLMTSTVCEFHLKPLPYCFGHHHQMICLGSMATLASCQAFPKREFVFDQHCSIDKSIANLRGQKETKRIVVGQKEGWLLVSSFGCAFRLRGE